MSTSNNVLVVRVASLEGVNYKALRDDILESVRLGVLILPEDAATEIMELPPLGSAKVIPVVAPEPDILPAPLPEPSAAADEPEAEQPPKKLGRNANEKWAIMARLKAYRNTNGLGCWEAVVKASGGKLTDVMLRGMRSGTANLPIDVWRQAAKALDRLEAKEADG